MLKAGTKLFRVEGGARNGAFGGFYSFEKPLSKVSAEELFNLSKYGNTLEKVVTYELQNDVTVFSGEVAGGLGDQLYVQQMFRSSLKVVSEEALPYTSGGL